MAIKTFSWCPRVNASVETTHRIRKAQFGDGYAQIAGDGLNTQGSSWSLEFTGKAAYIGQIKAFIDEHGGIKSFIWSPPLGSAALWRCETYSVTALGGERYNLSATFEQAYSA